MKDLLKRRQLYGVDVQQLEDAQLDAVAEIGRAHV